MIWRRAARLLIAVVAATAIGASHLSADTDPPVFSEVSGSPYSVSDASDEPTSIAGGFTPDGKYFITADTNYQNVAFTTAPELDTLSAFAVSGGDSLTSPSQLTFGDGTPPTQNLPSAFAIDPLAGAQDTIAVYEGSSILGAFIGMFSLDPSTGQLTQWPGSPFPAYDSNGQYFSDGDAGMAFSPDGSMLAVAGGRSGHVLVYKVDVSNHTLSTQANLEETVGNASFSSVAWSPDGSYLAATDVNNQQLFVWPVDSSNGFGSPTTQMNADMVPGTTVATASSPSGLSLLAFTDGNIVRLFKINADGTLTEGPNSPFSPGSGVGADAVAFNANGTMLATTDSGGQRFSVMSVGADGTLANEGGSPYSDAPGGPNTVAFGPAGGLIATANNDTEGEDTGTVRLFAVAAPTATISTPADNGTVFQFMSVPTQFNCADSAGAPGIFFDGNGYGCTDSQNDIADHNTGSGSGHLNTNDLGPQTYSVTATSDDGQQSTTTIHYTVIEDNASVSMTASPSVVDASDSGGGTASSTTPVHVNVQVTSSSTTPGGQVTLVNGAGATVATLNLDGNGDASTTLTGLSPDAGPLKAEYGGANGPSATAPLRVGLDPVTLTLNQLPTLQPGSPVQLTGSVASGDSGDASPSGTITIYDGAGGPVVGTATLNGNLVGGSEPFTVTLQNGLTGGQHTLVADFSDIEQRFAAGSASEQVSAAASSSCYAVQAQPVSVATRANGVLSYQNVPVQVAPQTDACGSGAGVTSGGEVLLTASPPAYEQVTGFTVTTQDGGTSTVPVDNSPGAGQAATATITVTGPTSVTPVTSVVNPSSCPSVAFTSHWLGSSTNESDLASFTVSGAVGCSVTAPSTTETVAAGSSFQALPGTPLQITANSSQISSAAGDDDIDAIDGSPAGATVTETSTSFAMGGSATLNAEAKMVCTPVPAIVQSTGGTVAQSGEATIQSPGPMGSMLAPAATQNRLTTLGGYSAACPAAWGSGVVPGAALTYVATPTKDDQSLGLPASDPRTNWGVESFEEADQTEDSEASEAASTLASTSLTPDLVGTTVTSTPVIHTLDEPGGTGTSAESDHALAVGFRFERLACVTVSTDVASYGRDTAGVDTLGEYDNGAPITLGSAGGSLKIDTPPNCPAVGPDYYKPGTQIQVTAADPANIQSLSVLTEEQHPGAYDGTTDPDYFAPGSADTDLANLRGHRRSGPAKSSTTTKRSAPTKSSAPTKKHKPKPGASKKPTPAKKHKPKAAPRHIPKHAPPAAVRVPTVHDATSSATTSLATHYKDVAKAMTLNARRSAAELRARRAVERAERGTNVTALKRTSRAWGTAERKWWSEELAVAADREATEKAAMTQIDKLAAAQFGNGAAPSYGALPIISATLRNRALAAAIGATNAQVRRFNQLLRATRTAAAHHHGAHLKQELHELAQMDGLVRQHAAVGRRTLATDRRELVLLVHRETKADRAMVTHAMKLLTSAQRASRARTKTGSSKAGSTKSASTKGASSKTHASNAHASQLRAPRVLTAHDDTAANRQLYPDETASAGGFVKVPLSFQGTYADDTDGLIIQNGGDSHTATFTVGTSPMTVHATWGPSDCERPSVLPYDQSQVTVNVDGGAGACAGPGTVARLGTFVVNASPSGAAVPVVVVKGIAPDGQTQERIQVGSSESFPALADSTVQVQVCEPLEFGGQVTDTVGGGTSEFDGSEIDQFASVVPGTGSECAVPGFYTVGSQVRFNLPSFLQPVVSSHTIVNPYAPTDGSQVDCTVWPGDCTQQPATGTEDWEVDGTDVGSTAPTVTLDQNEPQHEVGLSMTVKCEKLTIDVQARYEEPGATLDTAPDCPVTYAGDGTTTDQGQGGNLETVTTAHYLAGDVAAFSTDANVGQDDWSNLPSQPSNDVYVSGDDTLGGGPFYVDFAGRFGDGGTTVSSNETIQMQEGGGYAQYESWPDWNMPTLLDLESDASTSLTNEAEDLYSIATTYVLPVLKQFYSELDTVFTTDPFSSLSNFETWAKSAGILLLSAEDPNAGELMLGADYTGALDSPGDFATYLGQVGRFAASTGVQTAFTVAQTAGLSGAVQIGLALGDAAIVEISNGLTDIGAPSALVTAIRSARVLTNGINALEDCTTEAAAGDEPPTAPSDGGTAESDTGSALSNALSNAYQGSDLNEPPPLAKAYNSFPEGGTLSDAGSVVADATRDAAEDSKVSIALNEIQLAHALPGPNYNWTASDYSNCLAAETVG